MLTKLSLAVALSIAALLLPAAGGTAEARNIYWASAQSDEIGRADLDTGGGVDESFISSGPNFPVGVAANADYIYWTNQNSNSLMRATLNGTNGITVGSGAASPQGVALNSTNIFWSNASGSTIMKGLLPDASSSTVLWSASTSGIAIDDTYIYWSVTSGAIGRARLDGTGSADPSFVTGLSQNVGIAVDEDYIYFGNIDAPAVGRVPKAGGTADLNFIPTSSSPWGMAVDSGYVYWANSFDHSIGRAQLNGSGAATGVDQTFVSVPGANFIFGVAVDPVLAPSFTVTPESGSFGTTTVGQTSASQSFTVHNDGAGTLNISNVGLIGSGASQFAITGNDCAAAIAPTGSCSVSASFKPTVAGSASAQLEFTHDASGSPGLVGLTGTGVAPAANTNPPPTITKLSVSARKPRKPVNRLVFSFDLGEPATVATKIERKYGRKSRARCRRTRQDNRRKKRCPIYRLVKTVSSEAQAGSTKLDFNASKLSPGLYRATLTATNSNGTSSPARVSFYRPWW